MRNVLVALILGVTPALAASVRTGVEVSEARIVATAPGATSASLYLSLTSVAGDTLLNVTTPASTHATILQLLLHGGQGGLRPMPEGLFIGHGQTVKITSGNRQIRMEGLHHGLVAGESIPVILTFARAGSIHLAVPVKSTGTATSLIP